MPSSIIARWSASIWSHRFASAYPNPFIAVSGERMSCAAAAMSPSRVAPFPTRRRAHSNRQTVAAAARFSDSARPACGTRTVASARATISCGRPWASLPKTNATSPPSSVA